MPAFAAGAEGIKRENPAKNLAKTLAHFLYFSLLMKQHTQAPWSQVLSELLFALSRRANQWMEESGTSQRLLLYYLREKTGDGS